MCFGGVLLVNLLVPTATEQRLEGVLGTKLSRNSRFFGGIRAFGRWTKGGKVSNSGVWGASQFAVWHTQNANKTPTKHQQNAAQTLSKRCQFFIGYWGTHFASALNALTHCKIAKNQERTSR